MFEGLLNDQLRRASFGEFAPVFADLDQAYAERRYGDVNQLSDVISKLKNGSQTIHSE